MSNESFSELIDSNESFNALRPGALVTGKVLKIFRDSVLIESGLKSESFVKIEQFVSEKGVIEVEEGDELEFILEAIEAGNGETRLSREKAKQLASWSKIAKSYKNGDAVEGTVLNRIKGGFSVELDGLTGFLPGSLADLKQQQKDVSHLEGKSLQFKVIKMDSKRNNIVLSHRDFLEENQVDGAREAMETMFEGKVVKGTVKNLTEYGAFIDLGSIDGLLHVTDMRWKRVNNPSEMVKVGDELELVILSCERGKGRISLGLKQLSEDPWDNVNSKYQVGEQTKAEVSNVTDYGCFVTLDDGIEGLVHISEMAWNHKTVNPHELIKVGDVVDVQILGIDNDRHRISLGLKQCSDNPWKVYSNSNSVGDVVKGKVSSVTEFGVFVELDKNLDGLIHVSDLSWSGNSEEILSNYKKGDDVEVQILTIDIENQKIAVGVKQLQYDFISKYMEDNKKNQIVTGVVHSLENKKVIIRLTDEVNGTIKFQEVYNNETSAFTIKVGDELDLRVLGYDKRSNLVNLSYRLAKEASKQEIKEYASSKDKESVNTIGSIFKKQLGFGKDKDSEAKDAE